MGTVDHFPFFITFSAFSSLPFPNSFFSLESLAVIPRSSLLGTFLTSSSRLFHAPTPISTVYRNISAFSSRSLCWGPSISLLFDILRPSFPSPGYLQLSRCVFARCGQESINAHFLHRAGPSRLESPPLIHFLRFWVWLSPDRSYAT